MINGTRSELIKLRTGTTFFAFIFAGVVFVSLASWGTLTATAEAAPEGALDPTSITTEVIRGWFAMSLVIAMFGAYFVARDFSQGTAARSIILGGGRNQFIASKLVAGAVIGAVGAVIAALLSIPITGLLLTTEGVSLTLDHTTWMVIIGCAVVNLVAGIWGVCLGLLIRNTIVSLITVVGLCLLIEPALHAIAPQIGQFFMTNAMGSLYLDTRPGLLDVPQASITVALWLLVLAATGYLVTTKKDLT